MKKERYVPLKATAIPLRDGQSFSMDLSVLLKQAEGETALQQQKEPANPGRTQQ